MDPVSLRARVTGGDAVVAGVLSGTSADGIDVALARPRVERGRLVALEPIAFSIEPFAPDLARALRACLDGGALDLAALARLQRDLGSAFGHAARAVAERAGVALDLVGSHGQTVWHHDGREPSGPATLQLGDGDWVAEAAGCAVVSDFRQRDVAAGGEGAPLCGCVDPILFARAPRPACVLNLGGMANLTYLGAPGEGERAFDTGPANALLDGLARRLLGAPCDRDGAAARLGRADRAAVGELLAHPFFRARPPKSTGRDTFGEAYLDAFLARVGGSPQDRLASAVLLVAESVALAVREHLPAPPAALHVAGGGVHNPTLLSALGQALERPIRSSAELSVDPDAREALAFAALAARWVLGEPSSRPDISGAAEGRVLGKLSPAIG